MGLGAQSRVLLGLRASPGPSLSQVGCGGPQAQLHSMEHGDGGCPSIPPPTCPDSNLWLGVLPVPGALRCPPAPPCHTVGRGKTGSPVPSLWPRAGQECAEAAGSCQEEPGSTRPRIACELIATSRRSLQHPRACRGAQPWDPPCRAPSSQFYAPAGLRAYAGTSPGMGVPGQQKWGPQKALGKGRAGASSGARDSFVSRRFGTQLPKCEARSTPEPTPRQMLAGAQGRLVLGPTPSSASAPGGSRRRAAGGVRWALPPLGPASLNPQ